VPSPSLAATVQLPRPERALPLAERLGAAEFAAFYEEVAPRLWAYLYAHCRHRGDADDLCQESFVRVLASRLEPQSDEHLVRYLFKTATHLLHDRGRSAGRAPLPLLDDDDAETTAGPDGLRLDLERALGALGAKQRQILWLAHVEGMDHRTIAETVGARPASIRVMLHRARRKLAGLLGRPAGEGARA